MRLFLLAILFYITTSCASSLGDRCNKWDFVSSTFELGWGVTYKTDKYVCSQFKLD